MKFAAKIKTLLVTGSLFLMVSGFNVQAQTMQTLYHMNLPQNHLLNPALFSSNSVYIGLPGLSGAQLNFENNLFDFSDVIISGTGLAGDSLVTVLHPDYDINNFLELVNDRNYLNLSAEIPILSIGFRVQQLTFTFDVMDRVNGFVALPGDLMRMALDGNTGFEGSEVSLKEFGFSADYYREYALGFSMPATERLRVGGRAKMLFGKVNASLDINELNIAIDDQTFGHTFNSDFSMNISGPLEVVTDAEGNVEDIQDKDVDPLDILLNGKNAGFGIDLGATYDLMPDVTLSASIVDLGFISWKDGVNNLTSKGSFDFDGLDLTDVFADEQSFDDLAQEYLDSLVDNMDLDPTYDSYTTFLPAKVFIGASYKIAEPLSVGLLSRTTFIDRSVRQAVTLSANAYLANFFSLTAAYTAANKSFDHLGFGMGLRGGPLQFYLVTDHIPVSWNKIVADGSEVPMPTSLKTINLRFGFNLMFGNNLKKKRDTPMLVY